MAPVAPPSIGPKLRKARIDRSLSIEETAWRTRIRPDLLRALEDERFDVIGQSSLVRSNLSSYARFLGMDAIAVVQEFTSLQPEPEPSSIEEL
ncbi:MAG TPA: helix-turn-helix domain-containing protein, partial [Actinomycetota bacterium]|nr:helix-turn-helix domain-containing protein [Actinomycetota bacterium]